MARKSKKNVGLIGLGIIGTRVANALRGSRLACLRMEPHPARRTEFPGLAAAGRGAVRRDPAFRGGCARTVRRAGSDGRCAHAATCHPVQCHRGAGGDPGSRAPCAGARREVSGCPLHRQQGAAEAKQLVYYIGGEDEVLQRVEPVLQASSKAIVKIGKIGDAAMIKVATNMIAAVTGPDPGGGLRHREGIGHRSARRCAMPWSNNAIRSVTMDLKLAKILDRDYEPHFSLKHMFKDVQLGIHIANALMSICPPPLLPPG